MRPLEAYSRLGGENLHHFLLFLGEGRQGAKGGCRYWNGECTLGFFYPGAPHSQYIVHDAHTGRNMGPQTPQNDPAPTATQKPVSFHTPTVPPDSLPGTSASPTKLTFEEIDL